ncbi:MAG: TonB-dependent receptor [Acidobacteria bacterium]|nr:TonB-dependent receptor [Acidobacteriota bacterium]
MTSSVLGQVPDAEISGIVRDPSGAIIPQAELQIVNDATGVEYITVVNEEGRYVFRALRPGSYTLKVMAAGFSTKTLKGITLNVGHQARLDVSLELGETSNEVTVTYETSLLQAEGASIGSVITDRQVEQLPVNGRNFVALASLAPGVSFGFSNSWQRQYFGKAERGQYSIAQAFGLRPEFTKTTIDGINTQEIYRHWTSVIYPSMDMIQQFKAETSNYRSEFTGGGGVVLNVATKSGSAEFHGSAYEFAQNRALNARNFFLPANRSKPDEKYHQFGGSLGGPILKKRTFFFASYEGLRIRNSFVSYTRVPTALERKGDFSESLAVQRLIYDPLTTRQDSTSPNGYARDPFPGNVIPTNRIFAPSQALADLMFPLPNNPSNRTQNYIQTGTNPDSSNQWSFRIDHNQSEKHRIFGRWTEDHRVSKSLAITPGYSSDRDFDAHSGVLGWNYVISPTMLSEVRFGYTRYTERSGSSATEVLLGPGGKINLPYGDIPAELRVGLCCFRISGFPRVELATGFPYINNGYQLNDKISWTKGRHSLLMGASVSRHESIVPRLGIRGGFPIWAFRNAYTGFPYGLNAAKTYETGFGDFILGIAAEVTPFKLLTNEKNGYWYRHQMDLFADDQIQVTPNISLTLGLRYTFIESLKEKNNIFSRFDFKTGEVVFSTGAPSFKTLEPMIPFKYRKDGPNRFYDMPPGIFQPRISIAWSPGSSKTVIRMGYALYSATVQEASTLENQRIPPYIIGGQRNATPLYYENAFKLWEPPVSPDPVTAMSLPSIETADSNVRLPYIQMWTLDVQRQLGKTMTASLGYVGNKQTHISYYSRPNAPLPGPGPLTCPYPHTGPDCRSPYPAIGRLLLMDWQGIANYHGMTANVTRRFADGFMFTASYSFGKALGTIDELTQLAGNSLQRYDNSRLWDYSRQGFDFRHIFRSSMIYELPIGRGRRLLKQPHPLIQGVLGGWELSGLLSLQSGQPFGVYGGLDTNTGRNFRPNRICNGSLPGDQRTLLRDYDTACFANQAPYTEGNAARNVLVQRPLHNLDLGIQKFFDLRFLSEISRLQFRAEMFNATNTPFFSLPNRGCCGDPNAGMITSTDRENRIVQLGLKLTF